MSFYGTPWMVMQYAANRALRREIMREKIEAWRKKQRKHVRNTEAYKKACEDNKRLGLYPQRYTQLHDLINFDKRHKRPVTMPGSKPDAYIDPRGVAEEKMIAVIRESVEVMAQQLVELSHVPNPRYNYHNRVHQKSLADLIAKLARTVNPPCQLCFGLDIDHPRVVPLEHCCVDCGGPATRMSRGAVWYCEDCVP